MNRPLRPEGEGPESPEALMISALIDSGQFTPEKYHLTEDHLTCWQKLWRLGVEHQQISGEGPPLSLIRQRFPEFEITHDINIDYAARELHKAHSSRQLRQRLTEAIDLVKSEEIDQAYSLLEGIQRPRSVRKEAFDLWTHNSEEDDFEVTKIPVPWDSLGRVTGGIGPSELWYLAGRPGTGKTYGLCEFSAKAIKAGYNVRYVSLEMSAAAIHKRVKRSLAQSFSQTQPDLLGRIDSPDRNVYKEALDDLRELVEGSFAVIDPSHGKATNHLVREQMEVPQCDLVVVDHVGLMYTNDNRKAIDDWRAMASISNILKEDCLATGVPILSAVQLNREAEHGTSAPKLNQLSQSDALGQDADVVVTMRMLTRSVRLYSAEKNREGAPVKWWTRFDPERARFDEVKQDIAVELQMVDEDRDKGSS